MREYRHTITTIGQHSPVELNDPVRDVLMTLDFNSIADIGCGTGFQSSLLKKKFNNVKFIGVDFSPATIDYLKTIDLFDEIYLASSKQLPLPDKYTDVALSMENLEHLYTEDVLHALYELQRIGKYILITTPTPDFVVNIAWLTKEINEAYHDNIPLTQHDYVTLESCVHKSVILPESLLQAGFTHVKIYNNGSQCYYAESSKVDLSKIRIIGIEQSSLLNFQHLKDRYLDLLYRSLYINSQIRCCQNLNR